MDRDILLKAFKAGSMPLTLEEIEMIMDEEMEKDPSEMDGDLVEACLDILTKASGKSEDKSAENSKTENGKNKKRTKLKRMLLFAAIIAVLTGAAIPVCAKYIRNEASDDVVRYNANHFEINLSSENNEAVDYSDENVDIVKALNEKGFDNVILPAEFLREEYVKNIVSFDKNNLYSAISINFKNKNKTFDGNMVITKHNTESTEFMIGQTNTSGYYYSVKQLLINGMDVLVFSNNERSYIIYINNDMLYEITINSCDLDSAVGLAESLE